MNEEFEEWAEKEGYDLTKVHGRYTHSNTRDVFIGWQRREPEIDAIKHELKAAEDFHVLALEERNAAWDKIEFLKAEVSRLNSALMRDAISDIQNVERAEVFPVYARDERLREAAEKVLECFDSNSRYSVGFESACENLRSVLEKK